MRSFENGHTVCASNAAGNRKDSWLGRAVGFFFPKKKVAVTDNAQDRKNPVEVPSRTGETLVRVTVWSDATVASEVQVLKGAELKPEDADAAKVLAGQLFSERAEHYLGKDKILSKLDVDVRCSGGVCVFVEYGDPYVASAAKVAEAAKHRAA